MIVQEIDKAVQYLDNTIRNGYSKINTVEPILQFFPDLSDLSLMNLEVAQDQISYLDSLLNKPGLFDYHSNQDSQEANEKVYLSLQSQEGDGKGFFILTKQESIQSNGRNGRHNESILKAFQGNNTFSNSPGANSIEELINQEELSFNQMQIFIPNVEFYQDKDADEMDNDGQKESIKSKKKSVKRKISKGKGSKSPKKDELANRKSTAQFKSKSRSHSRDLATQQISKLKSSKSNFVAEQKIIENTKSQQQFKSHQIKPKFAKHQKSQSTALTTQQDKKLKVSHFEDQNALKQKYKISKDSNKIGALNHKKQKQSPQTLTNSQSAKAVISKNNHNLNTISDHKSIKLQSKQPKNTKEKSVDLNIKETQSQNVQKRNKSRSKSRNQLINREMVISTCKLSHNTSLDLKPQSFKNQDLHSAFNQTQNISPILKQLSKDSIDNGVSVSSFLKNNSTLSTIIPSAIRSNHGQTHDYQNQNRIPQQIKEKPKNLLGVEEKPLYLRAQDIQKNREEKLKKLRLDQQRQKDEEEQKELQEMSLHRSKSRSSHSRSLSQSQRSLYLSQTQLKEQKLKQRQDEEMAKFLFHPQISERSDQIINERRNQDNYKYIKELDLILNDPQRHTDTLKRFQENYQVSQIVQKMLFDREKLSFTPQIYSK